MKHETIRGHAPAHRRCARAAGTLIILIALAARSEARELSYSTYLGSGAFDQGRGVAIDADGNAYVVGRTGSDAFLSKFDRDGQLQGSIVFGGSGQDEAHGVAIDRDSNIYVVGDTTSSDFPTVEAFQSMRRGLSDVFVVKFDPTGQALYSTYLGGSETENSAVDERPAIAVDVSGNAYIVGTTRSTDFPVRNALQPQIKDDFPGDGFTFADAFVTKLLPGGAVAFSTYLGGNGNEKGLGIAVDPAGSIRIAGETNSVDFPLVLALKGEIDGVASDAFVARLDPTGSRLIFSTYFGGDGGADQANAVALDPDGETYVTGFTSSGGFATNGAFQPGSAGSQDAFIARLSADGRTLRYYTYLGSNAADQANAIAVGAGGRAAVTGFTSFTPFENFPVVDPLQGYANNLDAFVTVVSESGSSLPFSTYLGGGRNDRGAAIAIDGDGALIVTGFTESNDFPTANASQARLGSATGDAFVSKISEGRSSRTVTPSPTPTPPSTGPCLGDCNRNGEATADELVTCVRISLGDLALDVCRAADGDGNGNVTVDELVRAVRSAAAGCPSSPTRTTSVRR